MENKKLIDILREEQYPEYMIENTVKKIENFNPLVDAAFSEWMIQGLTPTIEVEGYSYNQLIGEYGMKPIGAFIVLDWLIRDPVKAIESLRKGVK